MVDVHNKEGKIIATIHNPEAFAQLLDEFEQALRDYSVISSPFTRIVPDLSSLVGQDAVDQAKSAAGTLEQIRLRFGDTRTNRYPIEFPRNPGNLIFDDRSSE